MFAGKSRPDTDRPCAALAQPFSSGAGKFSRPRETAKGNARHAAVKSFAVGLLPFTRRLGSRPAVDHVLGLGKPEAGFFSIYISFDFNALTIPMAISLVKSPQSADNDICTANCRTNMNPGDCHARPFYCAARKRAR